MQEQRLYIGKQEYSGLLGAKPNIPFGEIWVFAMHNGDYTAATREDCDYIPPPPPPWMKRHAAVIIKLRKQATYTIQQQYLTVSAYPTTIPWSITAKVRSPIAYVQSGQYDSDNLPQLSATLVATLQDQVEEMLMSRLSPVITNPHDLTPPPLQQLLPTRDFSHLVRGAREFREIGLDVSVVALDILCPAYQKLVTDVTIGTQEALIGSQSRLITAANDLEIALRQLGFEEQRLRSIVGQVAITLPYLPLVEKAIEQLGQTTDPLVAERVIRRLFDSISHPLQQRSPGIGVTPGGASPAQGQLPSGDRDTQVQQLYQTAQNNGWVLFPPQYKGGEMIKIDLGRGRDVELVVPRNYPGQKARVDRGKSQGIRLPKTEIDRTVQNVTAGPYDLVTLVEELDNSIQ